MHGDGEAHGVGSPFLFGDLYKYQRLPIVQPFLSLSITFSFSSSTQGLKPFTSITMPLAFTKPQGEAGAVWPAIAVGAFVAFGGVLFGK